MARNRLFLLRRIRSTTYVVLTMLAAGWLLHHQHQALRDSAFYSGYALFGCVLFLSAYNFRKKFPALSIG
ncbi:MAG: hypothetical protein KDA99_11675, partial [Planctomycetales bacterium]|nr:hypothetical protein [Planctomycetales bacterium]